MSNPAGRPRLYPDAELTCKHCQKTFFMKGSEARAYEKKHGRSKPYCSMICFYAVANRNVRDLDEPAPLYVCEGCGKETKRRRDTANGKLTGWDYRQKYCSLACTHQHTAAKFAERRAGGDFGKGHISADGYHVVKGAYGKQLKMHRLVMEKIIGRSLRDSENVHHINGNRADNRPENLELWMKAQPCGQRVLDKVAAAIQLLDSYPEFVKAAGRRLCSDKCTGG